MITIFFWYLGILPFFCNLNPEVEFRFTLIDFMKRYTFCFKHLEEESYETDQKDNIFQLILFYSLSS